MSEKKLISVLGSIGASEIGFMQSHEHIFLSKGQSYETSPVLWMDDVQKSTEELRRYYNAGGRTLADAQPVGCGRMCRELKQASEASRVNIIACTGFHKMCFYPKDHWIFRKNETWLSDLFISEIREGMFDVCDYREPEIRTDIKAGFIKAALDACNLTMQYEKLFSAAAAAALATGSALMIHIEKGSDPLTLLPRLFDAGIDPSRIILCHTDRASDDIPFILELASAGVFLEMDTIGRFKYHSDAREIEIFRALADAGYENRLLFSLDTTRARMKSYTDSAVGLDYLIRSFVPALEEAGITGTQIHLFSHNNCAEAFGI